MLEAMWNVKQTVICVFFVVAHINVARCQLGEGDYCYHNRKDAPGTCKLITQCQIAMQELRQGTVPQNCGFKGSLPIVCCVSGASPTPSPTPPSTTKPTTTPTTTTTTTTAATTTTTRQQIISSRVGEKSLRKCEEYKQYSSIQEISPVLVIGVSTQERKDCPFDKVELIIGGEKAKEKEFPHMALIGFDNGKQKVWDCGGTLISNRYILTAAHCLYSRIYGEPTTIRLGELNIVDSGDDEHVQQIPISEKIPHPDYKYPSQYNDLALIKLKDPAKLGIYVRPACLYTKTVTKTHSAIATGWGFTEDGGSRSDTLLKVILEFFTATRCNITYGNEKSKLQNGIVDRLQICAGSDVEERDTCQGDSGGPFQIYSATYCMYDIIGVTSFGKSCGHEGIPAVYTRVYPYLGWIESIVWP